MPNHRAEDPARPRRSGALPSKKGLEARPRPTISSGLRRDVGRNKAVCSGIWRRAVRFQERIGRTLRAKTTLPHASEIASVVADPGQVDSLLVDGADTGARPSPSKHEGDAKTSSVLFRKS